MTSIYTYGSFGEYFSHYVRHRKTAGGGRVSYRAMARRLRLKSPSLLAMIARGERHPTPAMLHKLCDYMQLSGPEARYAEALVGFKRARDIEEQLRCARELRRLKPANSELVLELETLEMIAKWYAVVILEMTRLPDFKPDAEWISRRLGATVSAEMARETLATLERHGLLEKDKRGRVRKVAEVVRSTVNLPATAIRSFHKQVLLRAHQAIDRQTVQERYFTTLTLPVPKSKIAQASKLIGQFRDEFMRQISEDGDTPDEIYHLAVQFFRATDR